MYQLSGYLEVGDIKYPVINADNVYYLMDPNTQQPIAYLGPDNKIIDITTNQPIGIFDPNTGRVTGIGAYGETVGEANGYPHNLWVATKATVGYYKPFTSTTINEIFTPVGETVIGNTKYLVAPYQGKNWLINAQTGEAPYFADNNGNIYDATTGQIVGKGQPDPTSPTGAWNVTIGSTTGTYQPYQTGFNIPTNLFPFSVSQQTHQSWQESQSRQYLPDWAANLLEEIVTTLKNPSAFAYSVKPAINQAFTSTLGELAKRGVIGGRAGGSSIVSKALGEVGRAIPQAWGQTLVGAGGLLGQARESTAQSRARSSGQSFSFQANPLAPYSLMGSLLSLL